MNRSGFTLVELLVAMAIFGLVAVMAFGGLNTVMNTREAVKVQSEELKRLQLAYRLIEQDFEQALDRPVRDPLGDERGALLAQGASAQLLELTRDGWTNPTGQPRTSLQRIQYGLFDAQLLRRYWIVLDQAQDSEPVERALLDGVERVEIRFRDGEGQWHDQWPPVNVEGAPGLPSAAEMTLELQQWGELRWLFRMAG